MEELEIYPEGESKEPEIIPSNIKNNNELNQNDIIKNLISQIDLCNKELKEQKSMIEGQKEKINQLETKVKYLEDENMKIKNELKNISTKNNENQLAIENKEKEKVEDKNENKIEDKEEKNQIINSESFKQLNTWINPNKLLKFDLIFKASTNGDTSDIFHKICDGKGPTLTIVKGKNGHIFGGYLTVPFSSDRKSHSDDKAFLFSLTNKKKFNIIEVDHAVHHYDKGWGPYIGYKDSCDLAIKSECLSNKKSKCDPTSYDFKRAELIGTNEKCFEVEDYEIYLVK